MITIVLDVDILASAALNDRGLPAHITDMALRGDFELAISNHILEPVEPDNSVLGVAPDLEDDLVLGTAVAANANYLVTGDKGLLGLREYRGVRIVTASEVLEEIALLPPAPESGL